MIKVVRPWYKLEDQFVDLEGREFCVADLVEESKDFKIKTIKLEHLSLKAYIGGSPLLDFAAHMQMVEACEMQYPIILSRHGSILDGRHRVVKALLTGQKSIEYKRFETNPKKGKS